jgi:hypothetical protein
MIPDFSESELDTVRTLSQQRFKKEIELHIADAELSLDKETDVLTECPTLFFRERACNFALFKTGFSEFRCQFFYEPADQYGTGHTHYNDLTVCIAALLQTQSDHERESRGVKSGANGEDLTDTLS